MSRRFINTKTLQQNEGAASWSDTEGFYRRVHWLASEAHAASNDDEDINDYFMALEQLHLEIEGAIFQEAERELIETKRKEILSLMLKGELDNKKLLYKRNKIREYHQVINEAAHKNGLFLKKSIAKKLDHWNNSQKNINKGWQDVKIEIQTDRNYTLIQPRLLR